jgi:hypothetical protein
MPPGPSPFLKHDPGHRPFFPPPDEQIPDLRSLFEGTGKAPHGIDPKAYKELFERLSTDGKLKANDFKDIFKDNPNFQNPEFLKALQKMMDDPNFPDNFKGKLPTDLPNGGENTDLFGKNLKDFLDQANRNSADQGTDWLNKQFDPSNGFDPSKADFPSLPNSPSGLEGIDPALLDNEWVKWLGQSFGDSPAAQGAMKDLLQALGNKHPTFGDWSSGMKNLPKLDPSRFGSSGLSGGQFKFRPPKFSLGSGPKSGGGWGGGGGGGGSSWGGVGSTGGGGGIGEGGGSTLAIIAGIVGAVVLGLVFLKKWKLGQNESAHHGANGHSPLDYEGISTREELVKAVDTLTVDKMGDDARQWNHRVIAEQFAESQPAHEEPAHELAGLYERARYSPPQEDLTVGEFGDARRDLKLLSGGQA